MHVLVRKVLPFAFVAMTAGVLLLSIFSTALPVLRPEARAAVSQLRTRGAEDGAGAWPVRKRIEDEHTSTGQAGDGPGAWPNRKRTKDEDLLDSNDWFLSRQGYSPDNKNIEKRAAN
ncbi:hypothetical protein BGZ83_010902 [Gryganskiella cystojenkinii]|nr:hypothetical protein BGZ83_010902 [Gryganskiella cystojenkinii]